MYDGVCVCGGGGGGGLGGNEGMCVCVYVWVCVYINTVPFVRIACIMTEIPFIYTTSIFLETITAVV